MTSYEMKIFVGIIFISLLYTGWTYHKDLKDYIGSLENSHYNLHKDYRELEDKYNVLENRMIDLGTENSGLQRCSQEMIHTIFELRDLYKINYKELHGYEIDDFGVYVSLPWCVRIME